MKTYTKTGDRIPYKNFIIEELEWRYKDSDGLYDITYIIYFKNNNEYFTCYMTGTLPQVKQDLDYWDQYVK